ncbi:MAG TPA: hypothetical protein VI916_07195 [Acidimicrobiia bacterium]|nr:hypothetical protein [Acidimicrobiia bacterium]
MTERLRLRRVSWPAILILAGSAMVVGLHVRAYTTTSSIDELSHIDTLIKASEFDFVQDNERVGQRAMREEACRGIDRGDPLPRCDTTSFEPNFFREYGVNVTAGRVPLYHLVTGLPARLAAATLGFSSIVTAARLLGFVWLAGGLFVTWLLMKELGVGPRPRAVALGLLATTPVVLHASAIVNADAALLLAGASVTYVVLLWERNAVSPWLAASVVVVALLAEPTTLLGVGLASIYLLVRSLGSSQAEENEAGDRETPVAKARLRYAGLGLAAVGVLLAVGFPATYRALIGDATVETHPVTPAESAAQHHAEEISYGGVSGDKIFAEVTGLMTPVIRAHTPPFLRGAGADVLVAATHWVLIGALFAALAFEKRGGRAEAIALATLVVLLVAGPAHAALNARRDVFFAIPTRFGLPLLPSMFALYAHSLRKPRVLAVAAAGTLAGVTYILFRLV